MSGRLIILPKKSYCPWNPSNVERVLRDERNNAEEQEQEAAKREQETSRLRLQTLRQKRGLKTEEESLEEKQLKHPQHVNLFAAEEEEHRTRVENVVNSNSAANEKRKNGGIMPLYLGQSAKPESFYLQAGSLRPQDQEGNVDAKDQRLKRRMDPMKEFVREEKSTSSVNPVASSSQISEVGKSRSKRLKRRRKSSKHGTSDSSASDSESSSSSSSDDSRDRRRRRKRRESSSRRRGEKQEKKSAKNDTKNSIEELRRRREEREQKERQRQESVVAGSVGLRQDRRYLNQYHPRLSRN